MNDLKALKMTQYRLEELLLNYIGERLSQSLSRVLSPDDTIDENELAYLRAYKEGYSDAVDRLWEIVGEHIEANEMNLHLK